MLLDWTQQQAGEEYMSSGGAQSVCCAPNTEGSDAEQENDLDSKDGEVLPGAVGVARLELLCHEEHRPQQHYCSHLHSRKLSLRVLRHAEDGMHASLETCT